MALITSAASGNFNSGATWTGGVVPGVGDEARASTGHTVTITSNVTCDEVSNAGTGLFTLNDGVTLTANVTSKSATASRSCLQFTAASPAVGYIVGNLTGGSVISAYALNNNSSGTINITGNVTAGAGGTASGIVNSGSGIINVTGNVTGGSGNSSFGINGFGTGTINITGNVTAGAGTNNHGIHCNATPTLVNITGNVTGGSGTTSHGVNLVNTGNTLTVIGVVCGGTTGASHGVNNPQASAIIAKRAKGNDYGPGNTANLASAVGVSNGSVGIVEIEELEFGLYGQSPVSGTGIRLKKVSTNAAVFNYCDTAGAKTLIDATQNAAMPAASNVRSGVSYASGALTGSCAVPAAGSVSLGVPVDQGFGTAVLTPASVWSHASRTITGGLVDTATTLTNAPTVPTASQIASQVRTELSSELAKVSALNPTRLSQVTTTEILGNLLSQANS
jgi:hypothetical protein